MDVVKPTRYIRPAHVTTSLAAETREEAVRELAALFAASRTLTKAKADALAADVLARESEGTTGIGCGVAVPHAKTALVDDFVVAVGVSRAGIDFASVDGDPVHVVFLIAAAPSFAAEYLALMKWVVSLTRSKYWMKLLRGAPTADALVEVLEESHAPGPGR
jgi:mannitol/fructose-specific phosphotransferase system IIA component (Ntr-type)